MTPNVSSLVALLCLCLFASAPATGAAPGTQPAGSIKDRYRQAVDLHKMGKSAEALPIMDGILRERPDLSQALFVRARIKAKLKDRAGAEADLKALLAKEPEHPKARKLLERLREGARETVTLVPSASPAPLVTSSAEYSNWDRVYTVPGKKPFTLAQFQGAEGSTLYYFPRTLDSDDSLEALRNDAETLQAYFLRIVDLVGTGKEADLELPGAKDHKVLEVPYVIFVDDKGETKACGPPSAMDKMLKAIRDEAKKKQAPPPADAEPVSSVDFASRDDAIESIAVSGRKTVVMVTSPG